MADVNRDLNLGYPAFQRHWWPTAPMGFPDGLTCIVSPTGNRTRDGRHDGAGVGPLHQKFGFRDNFRFIKFPSHIGDLNVGLPAFLATLVTNYTNGITLWHAALRLVHRYHHPSRTHDRITGKILFSSFFTPLHPAPTEGAVQTLQQPKCRPSHHFWRNPIN